VAEGAKTKKLPGDVSHLQRLIGDHAADRRMPQARLQRWLNAMIVTAVLDRVRDEDGEPIFLLKGGVAMELRLQLRARATSDYDAAFRARNEEVIDRLDEALAQPWNNFDLTRDAPEVIANTEAVQIRLRLSYKRRSWGSVYLQMAPVEGKMGRELDRIEAMSLDPLQVPLPEAAHCVSLRYQVAQKLHACTEVFEAGRENDRFRDVMDILLLEDLLYDVGLDRVREACVDIFTVRDKHTWPPTVTVYDSWRGPFAELARENGFTPEDIDEAVKALTALIAAIEAANEPESAESARHL
jgi:hypothetical protein